MRSLVHDISSAASGERRPDPVRALREAVVRNLRDLCTTPRGSALVARAYGIDDPSLTFYEYPAAAVDLERQLREVIALFEPRLVNAAIRHVAAKELDLVLRFEITGSLIDEYGRVVPVRFSTVIDSNCHVDVI